MQAEAASFNFLPSLPLLEGSWGAFSYAAEIVFGVLNQTTEGGGCKPRDEANFSLL